MDNKHKYFVIVLLLIVFSLIAFGRILGNDFVNFDDDIYITKNQHIQSGINLQTIKWAFTSIVADNWHPLTLLSHALDWQLLGGNASGHHLINLLLHIGSALLLFLFLNKATKAMWASAFVAALYSLHPLRVESVAWAAERKDVLSMFFGMATLYAYVLYTEKKQFSKYIFCLLLFALGLMSKPMLVTLPFVLLLVDYWPLERWQKALSPQVPLTASSNTSSVKKKKGQKFNTPSGNTFSLSAQHQGQLISKLLWEKVPFIFLAIASSLVTLWAQHRGIASLDKLPLSDRIWNAFLSYGAYLGKIFWPVNLAVLYPYEYSFPMWQIFSAILLLLGISAAVIYFIKKVPFLFVGWFWYLGTLIPVIGLVQVGTQSMADRYTYLPSIGIGIMLAWWIPLLLKRYAISKKILFPAGIAALAVLAVLTWQQCGYWKNSIELFNHALQVTKDNYLAHINLGVALAEEGKINQAITHYLASIKINPYKGYTHYNLAIALERQGDVEKARIHYNEALRINPNDYNAHTNIGIILATEGKLDEAIAHYLAAIKINSNDANTYYNLANALDKQGKVDEAIVHYREAIAINPYHDRAHCNLGASLVAQGKTDEAIYHYLQALQFDPDNPGKHYNLGVALANTGKFKKAIEHFRRAITLKPDYADAHRALKLVIDMEKKQGVD